MMSFYAVFNEGSYPPSASAFPPATPPFLVETF